MNRNSALVLCTVFLLVLFALAGTVPATAFKVKSARLSATPSSMKESYSGTCPGTSSNGCPMGVADYGEDFKTGTTYSYASSQFLSTVAFTKLKIGKSTINGSPYEDHEMSIQQNIEAYYMYENGVPGTYWMQDVPFVLQSGSKYTIVALDNIWDNNAGCPCNMPSVTGNLPGACSSSGIGGGGQWYCESSQTFTTKLPFTVEIYMEVGIISSGAHSGESGVIFEFGITNSTYSSGLVPFDEVAFSGAASQSPYFYVAYSYAPIGAPILNDAETVIGGPGGGSSVQILAIHATFTEDYLNSANDFVSVPHAVSEGHDTAESATGIKMSSSGETGIGATGTDNDLELW